MGAAQEGDRTLTPRETHSEVNSVFIWLSKSPGALVPKAESFLMEGPYPAPQVESS